ncbi:predicted protein [Sclerotinia sclerotiorum 1980 UF-70]|uniref:Uncharacterized protein n=1 Tax=Sclerotinia sclerotiorum (strain ATCC 18683 / 1980 / Ss-1) TaxID=665079 RepID=A7F1K7_SCLS1|nr:predicted protein [Sclerotinia sclerotiorum 1980 UF-70]EDN95599.1 predicted protein [Sclerotinia sclerotiorum 1980 UF-70]
MDETIRSMRKNPIAEIIAQFQQHTIESLILTTCWNNTLLHLDDYCMENYGKTVDTEKYEWKTTQERRRECHTTMRTSLSRRNDDRPYTHHGAISTYTTETQFSIFFRCVGIRRSIGYWIGRSG